MYGLPYLDISMTPFPILLIIALTLKSILSPFFLETQFWKREVFISYEMGILMEFRGQKNKLQSPVTKEI